MAHFEDGGGGAADEFEVVADEADRALVVHDGVLQGLARGDVQVRGRFVEDEQVRRVHEDAREAEADLLAAGQHLALLHGVVAGEPERAEDLADARGRGVAGRGVLHDVVRGLLGGQEFGEFLRLVADHDVMPKSGASGGGGERAGDDAEERGLAHAVVAYDAELVAVVDGERDVAEDEP